VVSIERELRPRSLATAPRAALAWWRRQLKVDHPTPARLLPSRASEAFAAKCCLSSASPDSPYASQPSLQPSPKVTGLQHGPERSGSELDSPSGGDPDGVIGGFRDAAGLELLPLMSRLVDARDPTGLFPDRDDVRQKGVHALLALAHSARRFHGALLSANHAPVFPGGSGNRPAGIGWVTKLALLGFHCRVDSDCAVHEGTRPPHCADTSGIRDGEVELLAAGALLALVAHRVAGEGVPSGRLPTNQHPAEHGHGATLKNLKGLGRSRSDAACAVALDAARPGLAGGGRERSP